MSKSKNSGKDFDRLDKAQELLDEDDWEDERTSQVTLNINPPMHAHTPSQFEKLKEMKTGTKAGIGGAIVAVIISLVEIARRLGWL